MKKADNITFYLQISNVMVTFLKQLNPTLPTPHTASEPLRVYMADNVKYDDMIWEDPTQPLPSGKLNLGFEYGLNLAYFIFVLFEVLKSIKINETMFLYFRVKYGRRQCFFK